MRFFRFYWGCNARRITHPEKQAHVVMFHNPEMRFGASAFTWEILPETTQCPPTG